MRHRVIDVARVTQACLSSRSEQAQPNGQRQIGRDGDRVGRVEIGEWLEWKVRRGSERKDAMRRDDSNNFIDDGTSVSSSADTVKASNVTSPKVSQ